MAGCLPPAWRCTTRDGGSDDGCFPPNCDRCTGAGAGAAGAGARGGSCARAIMDICLPDGVGFTTEAAAGTWTTAVVSASSVAMVAPGVPQVPQRPRPANSSLRHAQVSTRMCARNRCTHLQQLAAQSRGQGLPRAMSCRLQCRQLHLFDSLLRNFLVFGLCCKKGGNSLKSSDDQTDVGKV